MYTARPTRSLQVGFPNRMFQMFETCFTGQTPAGGVSGYFGLSPMSIVQPCIGPGGVANFNSVTNGSSTVPGSAANLLASYPQWGDFASIYSQYRCHWYDVEIQVTPALAGDAAQVVMLPVNYSQTQSLTTGPATMQQLIGQPLAVTGQCMFGSPILKLKQYVRPEFINGMTKAQINAQVPGAVGNPGGASSPDYFAYQWVRWGTCDGAVLAGQLTWVIKIRCKVEGSNRNILIT
jgi:hypothetical protein